MYQEHKITTSRPTTQNKPKQFKPRFGRLYDLRPGTAYCQREKLNKEVHVDK